MNARGITKTLGGRWHGSYGMVKCPTHHPDTEPSLKIADTEDGGVTVHCFAGCDWRDVKDALRREGLLPGWELGATVRPDTEARARREAELEAEEQARIETARTLWRQARSLTQDDTAGRYLASRGLHGPWPPSLRFLEAAQHPSGVSVPALIAGACRWPDKCPVAVQLTALTPQGRKADLKPLRWTHGVLTGAAVRFAPWDQGKTIVVVEGVEDGLAVSQVVTAVAPWALLGASNAGRVILPAGAEVVLALDGDDVGRKAAQEAGDVLTARGHKVKIARLPAGADPADLLMPMTGRAA